MWNSVFQDSMRVIWRWAWCWSTVPTPSRFMKNLLVHFLYMHLRGTLSTIFLLDNYYCS